MKTIKKIENFVKTNIAYFILITALLVLVNTFKISSIQDEEIINQFTEKFEQYDEKQKVIIEKIDNTSGDNLFSIVNNLMRNNVLLDSLTTEVGTISIEDSEELNKINVQLNSLKVKINKIETMINELQPNTEE